MTCPHCASTTTKEQTQKTTLGYRMFRCSACKHLFNERTGTPFNFLEYPTDIVLLKVDSFYDLPSGRASKKGFLREDTSLDGKREERGGGVPTSFSRDRRW